MFSMKLPRGCGSEASAAPLPIWQTQQRSSIFIKLRGGLNQLHIQLVTALITHRGNKLVNRVHITFFNIALLNIYILIWQNFTIYWANFTIIIFFKLQAFSGNKTYLAQIFSNLSSSFCDEYYE